MIIDWHIDESVAAEAVPVITLLQAAADCCEKTEGISLNCAVSVRFCNDEAISRINQSYRGISDSTDVLSFPTVSWPAGQTAGKCGNLLRREYDDDLNACFLGDIIISVPHIFQQAEAYGHSADREAAFLLIHGLCHLMGYDHIKENERVIMRKMEETILSSVGLSREKQNAVSDQTLLMLAQEAMKRSYSPYSRFPVGAALLSSDGRIFLGCNIENASLGATNCAERTALFKAVSEGARSFDAIAIAANKIAWPCGICRQALREFAPELRVLVIDSQGHTASKTLLELLPESFGPSDLL